jgi:hypothetical protein
MCEVEGTGLTAGSSLLPDAMPAGAPASDVRGVVKESSFSKDRRPLVMSKLSAAATAVGSLEPGPPAVQSCALQMSHNRHRW